MQVEDTRVERVAWALCKQDECACTLSSGPCPVCVDLAVKAVAAMDMQVAVQSIPPHPDLSPFKMWRPERWLTKK